MSDPSPSRTSALTSSVTVSPPSATASASSPAPSVVTVTPPTPRASPGSPSLELDLDQAAELLSLPRSERVRRLFGFSPFDYQASILDDPTPQKVVICGRQVGKTSTASSLVADAALTRPGEDVLIAARFQDTANELFRRTKQHLEAMAGGDDLESVGITTPNATCYEFDTGSRITSRTLGLDGSQLRGRTPSTVVIEEAALVEADVYRQVIRPMVATHSDYELILISTPRGASGWLYDTWLEAQDSDDWGAYHVETAANPLVSDEWLEAERSEVDETTWRQEYLGEFVEVGDAWLPHSVVSPCVADGQPERTGSRCWLGVDVARSGSDRSVYVSVDDDGNVYDVRSVDTESLDQAVGRIKALNEANGYSAIVVDENGLGGGVVDFSAASLPNVKPVTFSSKSKQQLYQTLKRTLESQALTLPKHELLIHELISLEYDFTSTGILRVSHPAGGRDDHADATALAVWGWQQAAGPTRSVVRRGTPSQLRRQRGGERVAGYPGRRRRIVRRRSGGSGAPRRRSGADAPAADEAQAQESDT